MKIYPFVFTLFLFALFCFSCPDIAKGEESLNSIVLMVENNLDKLEGNSIAVFPFIYPDGIKSMEGALISERLTTLLSESKTIKVVERRLLEKVIEEQKLSASGLVDPATAVKIGRIIGARGMLSGTVTDLGEKIEINARLFNVQTGEIIASKSVFSRKAIKTFISPLWDEIERIKQKGKSFSVRLWVEKDAYRIGEEVKIHFQSERDCYVTLFDFTSGGSIFVLFPNRFLPNNYIKAGRKYIIPQEDAGFRIKADGPAGLERLKLFATTKKISLFAFDYSQNPFRSIAENDRQTTRDLKAVFENLEDNAWAETHCEFRIENVLR